MVFDVFLIAGGSFAEVAKPEGFDRAVFTDENTTATLAAETRIDSDGV